MNVIISLDLRFSSPPIKPKINYFSFFFHYQMKIQFEIMKFSVLKLSLYGNDNRNLDWTKFKIETDATTKNIIR